MKHVPIVIGGKRSTGDDHLEVISPATGQPVATMARATAEDLDRAVHAARDAAAELAAMTIRQRAAKVAMVAELIERDIEPMARDLASEQGKPIAEARGEVSVAAEMWRDAAEITRHMTDAILPSDNPERAILTVRRPHGVLGVITPWNFPATIPTEYLCAGLAAGNAIVWKPSELTPMTALWLQDFVEEAGFPAGSVNLVPGMGQDIGAGIAGHRSIDAIGFTGSPATGNAITATAGPKPLLLELGGNNATVVLADADVDEAARRLAGATFANAGQICSSTERIIVERSIYDDLAEALAAEARRLRLGPSLDEHTTIGPLNNEATAAKVDAHIADATSRGATVLAGGGRASGHPTDLYYEPSILKDLDPAMTAFRAETFGPVAMLMPFDGLDQAADLVNDHGLGLVAGVLSTDTARAVDLGRRLRAGIVNIGDVATSWQPHSPFGGYSGRASGVGRIGGRYSIEELSQLQTFTVPARMLP
ncbi:aldehyde dehydrogenase family protein [Pseudactinotalea sp. Z1732]|uniref:aldehyde dehydrogenase family protein n=1 Tax=Pseudactinotalea sp. Z1732 TaxID=3413026 RepID=UPI003C7BDBE3